MQGKGHLKLNSGVGSQRSASEQSSRVYAGKSIRTFWGPGTWWASGDEGILSTVAPNKHYHSTQGWEMASLQTACCVNVRTRISSLAPLLKNQTWWDALVITFLGRWGRENPQSSLAICPAESLSSRFCERPCLRNQWWVIEEDTQWWFIVSVCTCTHA